MIRSLLRWPFFIFVIAMLFSCAASPNVSFYTLDKPHYPEARSENSSRLDILLGPLTVPEMVDRPQFVVRTGDNMVDIIDTRRWVWPPARICRNLAGLKMLVVFETANMEFAGNHVMNKQ